MLHVGVLLDEHLTALAHEEHREVIVIVVLSLNVVIDSGECARIVVVRVSDVAVTGQVDAVDLVELSPNVLRVIEVRDRDDAHTSLLKELDMGARHV
jgi:hypothetical protein